MINLFIIFNFFFLGMFLVQTLESCGWEVLESHAGVSMVAKPSAYLNKVVELKQASKDGGSTETTTAFETKINDSNIREAILRATGLCINSASWTGIPGYCRFTFALQDSEFGQALDSIVKFKDLFH